MTVRSARVWWVVAALTLSVACSNTPAEPAANPDPAPTVDGAALPAVEPVAPSDPDVKISALDDPSAAGLPDPLVDVDEISAGGPPPDGIPSIDHPRFLRADAVDFLSDEEPVLAFEIDGDVRAYPVQIMMWHEIVNDTVGGVPVAVTYCPLCNSAVALDRRSDGKVLEFGTSGLLYRSALVMYDRQTESLWAHFTGEAVVGTLAGAELETFPVSTVAWADWRDANPDALVLSRDTGFSRAYGRNPYPRYDNINRRPFGFEGDVDERMAAMTRIVGVNRGDDTYGVVLDALADEGVVELPDANLVVFHKPGTTSALQEERIDEGRDVGATGVFVPEADGRRLTFSQDGESFRDAETGSEWNIFGKAVTGPLSGEQLEQVEHVDTFWFALAAYRPDTVILP